MIGSIVKKTAIKILGTKNERELNRLQPVVERINSLEPEFQKLSNSFQRLLPSSGRLPRGRWESVTLTFS